MTIAPLARELQVLLARGRGCYAGRAELVFASSFADLADSADADTAEMIRSALASIAGL